MVNNKKNNQKIVLGMSGGVDSSVCAYLLKKSGYEVIGLFMQNWDEYLNQDIKGHINRLERECNVQKDFADAKKVADKLGIKIYRIEFIEKYWKNVFQYLIKEYKYGRTPNPDVLCNKYIKFGEFLSYAKSHFGCDLIAMGHYAKTRSGKLYMAKDTDKDQTYFLCWLTSEQLKHTIFPIGNLTKTQVRNIAKKIGLDNWSKRDSTGVCFIGEREFKNFLNNYIPFKKGNIVDISTNKIVGQHDGVSFFTYGQNKGLSLSGQTKKYFVCSKDVKKNILYVCDSSNRSKYLTCSKCSTIKFNWMINSIPKNKNILIRFRHRQPLIPGKFSILKNKEIILSFKPTLAITPGQFAVLYQNKTCLGGGIVNKLYNVGINQNKL